MTNTNIIFEQSKVDIVERLLTKGEITFREALILMDKEQTYIPTVPAAPIIPYNPPYWYESPYTVTCSTDQKNSECK